MFTSRRFLSRSRHIPLDELSDVARVRNAARPRARFDGVEQGLRKAHVELRVFAGEFERNGFELRKVGSAVTRRRRLSSSPRDARGSPHRVEMLLADRLDQIAQDRDTLAEPGRAGSSAVIT
jgi:hypothetical protein